MLLPLIIYFFHKGFLTLHKCIVFNVLSLDSNCATPKKEPEEEGSANQQQDWSILWSCFENPLSLLATSSGLPKGMQDMVTNAVSEMRRYYSRKVIDVLIKVTRSSLDQLRKLFIDDLESTNQTTVKPVFLLHSSLMIPNVSIHPNLDGLQEVLVTVGKNITGVSKGVAQWSSGNKEMVTL